MKFNVEIELDWIEEGMTISDAIKDQIIYSIKNQIGDKIQKQAEDKVNKMIDSTVVRKINELTDNMFAEFVNREISITDGYGSTVKTYPSIEALVKEKFDKFLTQPVDEKGNAHDGYGKKMDRISFIIDKQLKDFANSFTTEAVKSVSEEIKMHVNKGLTEKLGAELMKVLKVNDMLKIEA